jgi:hypothetical protein
MKNEASIPKDGIHEDVKMFLTWRFTGKRLQLKGNLTDLLGYYNRNAYGKKQLSI